MGTALTLEGRAGDRWRSYRLAGWLLRAAIFLAPLVGAVLTSLWLAPRLFVPVTAVEILGWWLVLVTASSAVAWLLDRLGRRLLPLSVMLRMTMLFPDRAPSRFGVALRSTNLGELRRRVAATDPEGETDLTEAAGLIMSLASALNDYDRRLRGHGERTRAYADMLAQEMNVPREGRDKLRWAALLHDIGKVEIPFEILNKDGPLDDSEKEIVRQHPALGMRVAAPLVPWLGEWARAIEDHHEWWDGSGYPRGLAGEEIALGARIVAVADAFDVMTRGRQYQSAISPAAAREEVARMAGRQFDPAAARALMNASLGRLRWSIGPLAWVSQIPFFLDRLGRDIVTVASAGVVAAATVASGIASLPVISSALEPTESVLAAQAADSSAEPGEPGRPNGQTPRSATGADNLFPSGFSVPEETDTTTTSSLPAGSAPSEPPSNSTTVPAPVTTTSTTAPVTTSTIPSPTTTRPSPTTTTRPDPTTTRPNPTTTSTTTTTPNPTTTAPNATTTTTSTTTTTTRPLRPPNAVDDTAGYHPGGKQGSIDVLANDTHPDGIALDRSSVRVTQADFPGVIVSVDNGVVTYRMDRGTTTTHHFVYRVCDVNGLCDTATVTLVKAP